MNGMSARETVIAAALTGLLLAVLAALGGRALYAEGNTKSCIQNLKQAGLVFKMYSNENRGAWPPVSTTPNNWMPDLALLAPEYVSDLSIFRCPGSPSYSRAAFTSAAGGTTFPGDISSRCVSSLYYNYTGYAISSDEQAAALWAAYHELPMARFRSGQLSLPVPKWRGADGSSAMGLPVMWDRVPLALEDFPHKGPSINVLHMDGSVKNVPYAHYAPPENFPVTRLAAITFGADAPAMPADCR